MSARFERLPSKRPPRLQRGVALLEALIATVILAIGLLGAIGMQARAYTALSEAGLRGEATIFADRHPGALVTAQTMLGGRFFHTGSFALCRCFLHSVVPKSPPVAFPWLGGLCFSIVTTCARGSISSHWRSPGAPHRYARLY